MKICLYCPVRSDSGGVYRYCVSLIQMFDRFLFREYDITVIAPTDMIRDSEIEHLATIVLEKVNTRPIDKILDIFLVELRLTSLVSASVSRELASSNLIVAPAPDYLIFGNKVRKIITIHDLQHKYLPNNFSILQRLYRDHVYKFFMEHSFSIICEAEHVKNDIIKFYDIDSRRVKIIKTPPILQYSKNAITVDVSNEIKAKYSLPDEYVFYPARFWPHKNHIRLIKSLKYIEKNYGKKIDLVLVGAQDKQWNRIMMQIEEEQMGEQVRYIGFVPQADIPYFYVNSLALVMPSLFESVSMPIWEAFSLGIPVVASHLPGIEEQTCGAALLFDPLDIEDMASSIYRICVDKLLQKQLVDRGTAVIQSMTMSKYAERWAFILGEISRGKKFT